MSLYISSFMKLKYLTRPYEFSVYQIHQRYVGSSSWHGGLRKVAGFSSILEEDFMPLTWCPRMDEPLRDHTNEAVLGIWARRDQSGVRKLVEIRRHVRDLGAQDFIGQPEVHG
jgi:hypothetical protein